MKSTADTDKYVIHNDEMIQRYTDIQVELVGKVLNCMRVRDHISSLRLCELLDMKLAGQTKTTFIKLNDAFIVMHLESLGFKFQISEKKSWSF